MSGPELVIHGHFYQPPRENPWTERVGRETSAAPAHDWNERIAAECYRPNSVARIVDDDGRVIEIVDNYGHISYNVGPTLLAWLERLRPDTYRRMVDGDKINQGAIAQAFGHTILPLSTEHDIRTQIRWGLADFRYRFGREALGMWLPECAVNDTVLRVMAEEGVGFTILAPGQAARVRPLDGSHDWVEVNETWFDTSHPYRWVHPDGDGKGVNLFFYNGDLSHAVAFEMSTLSSGALVDRMLAAGAGRPGLVSLATDGETFGHHHKYGERLLAYALTREASERNLVHTNFNQAYQRLAPQSEIQVHESAWSCAHGVGRWKEDCACSTGGGPGWNQKWRAPLRAALDQLRSVVTAVFDVRATALFKDPYDAVDAYVAVVIGQSTKEDFAHAHVIGDPVEAFTLLEMQRHAMAMFTSCGWFFNDLAGIETVQVLRYAARVLDLLEELDEASPLNILLAVLGEARSNDPAEGTGADIWHRHVMTARVDATRVVEHIGLGQILEHDLRSVLGPYAITVHGRTRDQLGSVTLATGVATLTHRRTGRRFAYAYAAMGLGGLEITGRITPVTSGTDDSALQHLRSAFARGASITQLLAAMETVGDHEFDMAAALPEEAERLMQGTALALEDRYASTYEQLYDDHRATLEDLTRQGYPLPPVLRVPAELALARRFRDAVLAAEASTDPSAYETAITVARQARAAGFTVDTPESTLVMQRLLTDVVERAARRPTAETVKVALDVLALKDELGVPADVEPSQEAVYFAMQSQEAVDLLTPLAKALFVAVPSGNFR